MSDYTMRVYLVRPAGAAAEATVRKVARHLKDVEAKVTEIWYAPDAAAQKTAEIIADGIGKKDKLEKHAPLADQKNAGAIAKALAERNDYLMLVAEQPFIHTLTASLLKADASKYLEIPPSGLWFLERKESGWTAAGTVLPEYLKS